MANRRDQIIEYGKAQGKSQQEIDKAVAQYEATLKPKGDTIGSDISTAFQGSVDYIKEGYEQAKQSKTPIGKTEAGLKMGAGAVGAVFSPLAPATKYIGQGIDYTADKISDNPDVQKFAMTKAGDVTSRIAEDVQNTSALLGLKGAKPVAGAIKNTAKSGAQAVGGIAEKVDGAKSQISGALRDIKPEVDSVINHQVSQALHLTPTDMSNFFGKMDTDVGRFMADNNLLGDNLENTISNLKRFKDENYAAVRSEIANVPKAYKISQVPRYYDALKQIYEQVNGVKGLEKDAVLAENMLKRDVVALEDVQAVKELLDDHFKLFKVTGDVSDAKTKQGVANMRAELKQFIEKEVKETTGADIAEMNKNVMGSKALLDASELRTPRGLKSYQLGMGDLAFLGFGSAFGGGLPVGIAALFIKKALETPSARLRISKIIDGWSDARKSKAAAEMQSGVIPNEFRQAIKIKHNGQRLGPDA